jgi:hypothetical protein
VLFSVAFCMLLSSVEFSGSEGKSMRDVHKHDTAQVTSHIESYYELAQCYKC